VPVRPGAILAPPAEMVGVSCSRPNRIACDRVGLAVWTRHPVRAVTVTLAGREVQLHASGYVRFRPHRPVLQWDGYLNHAGLLPGGRLAVKPDRGRRYFWTGYHAPVFALHVIVTGADGVRRATTIRDLLRAGWG
jgi:hypothetical protein